MGEVVADQFERLGLVLHGVDGDLGVGLDGPLQVPMRAVHGGADGLLGQRGEMSAATSAGVMPAS
jgi:hypothetical protein